MKRSKGIAVLDLMIIVGMMSIVAAFVFGGAGCDLNVWECTDKLS